MDKKFDRRTAISAAGAALVGLTLLRTPGRTEAATFKVTHSDAEWKRLLGPQRYDVLRHAATERPFTSPLLKEHRRGVFVCAGCSQPLFNAANKFESGTGWPSFWKALPGAIDERSDRTMFMERTETLCARCGGHLGHVFNDGPRPTGLRYCMNGLALKFRSA